MKKQIVNIYMPSKRYSTEVYYSPYGIGLDFKTDCSWDELISKKLNAPVPYRGKPLILLPQPFRALLNSAKH